LLAQLEDKPGRVVVVDLGGGVMTVARGDRSEVDALVVVVEPYPRSTEVGRRLLKMAAEKGIDRRVVVANKVTGDDDVALDPRPAGRRARPGHPTGHVGPGRRPGRGIAGGLRRRVARIGRAAAPRLIAGRRLIIG
jgi:hypothetical protein